MSQLDDWELFPSPLGTGWCHLSRIRGPHHLMMISLSCCASQAAKSQSPLFALGRKRTAMCAAAPLSTSAQGNVKRHWVDTENNRTTQAGEQELTLMSQAGRIFCKPHVPHRLLHCKTLKLIWKQQPHQVKKQVKPPVFYLHITDPLLPNSQE